MQRTVVYGDFVAVWTRKIILYKFCNKINVFAAVVLFGVKVTVTGQMAEWRSQAADAQILPKILTR